jgi:ribosome recycling factor
MSDIMDLLNEKQEKTKSVLIEDLNTVRAGRANPTCLIR